MKVRTAAKRDAILFAASQLFLELGYEGASMNELVRRLGGSKATLYGYFPSKEVLFAAVVRSIATSHLSNAVMTLQKNVDREADLRQSLQRFAEDVLQILTNDDNALAVYRMVLGESGRSDVGQIFYEAGPSEAIELLGKLLSACMARGMLQARDPHVCALQLLSLVTAETNARLYQQAPAKVSKAEIKRIAERAIETFLFGQLPAR
ncbi:TetR/AcrR family transcriptional regulator [Uliginosibacterium sediminicola]|uniref:TetR/AcrR family transcriptional regulator n=1 Tax=Uliginosibacterium sediminicola TaxID=2024550 RepID=A0ABU9Z312_9RHOO